MTTEASTDTKLTTDTKLKEIIAEQEEIFVRRQPTSARLAEQARQHLTGGVTSSWQITAPQPVWLSRGRGSKVWDIDGNEYVDLHGGYGAALAGHAHPAIARAISGQAENGTHDRRGSDAPGRPGHALRPADGGCGGGRRRAGCPVRPAAVAVRQLGHRGHHGRDPPDARDYRA